MNAYVASRAVLVARIGHIVGRSLSWDAVSLASEVPPAVVTLQTQRKHNWAQQQARIGGAVRSMAGLATIHTNAEMLEYKGPALIGMALETRLLVSHGLLDMAWTRSHSPGGSKGAVRIVAVRAGDYSFLDAVFEGHRELHAHIGVAFFTESGLGFPKQRVNGLRPMNRVATGTCHPIESVLGIPDVGPRERLAVAAKTGVEYFFSRKHREREDCVFSAVVVDVISGRSVASLAAGIFREFFA